MQLEMVVQRDGFLTGLCDKRDADLDLKLSPTKTGLSIWWCMPFEIIRTQSLTPQTEVYQCL